MKTKIEEVRRNDLIRAAYDVFQENGLGGMTVARIGERVGMSHGIVNYYFKNKDDLLHAVMRYAFRQISDEAIARLKQAGTPRERIDAVIRANFSEDIFRQETAAAWLSFYAHAPQNPAFARLQIAYYRRLHSDLKHALKQMMPGEEAERVAKGISILIDGMWIRRAMVNLEFSNEQILAFISDYLDDHLRAHGHGARGLRRARKPRLKRISTAD